jgi:hypothetical protein
MNSSAFINAAEIIAVIAPRVIIISAFFFHSPAFIAGIKPINIIAYARERYLRVSFRAHFSYPRTHNQSFWIVTC